MMLARGVASLPSFAAEAPATFPRTPPAVLMLVKAAGDGSREVAGYALTGGGPTITLPVAGHYEPSIRVFGLASIFAAGNIAKFVPIGPAN